MKIFPKMNNYKKDMSSSSYIIYLKPSYTEYSQMCKKIKIQPFLKHEIAGPEGESYSADYWNEYMWWF